MGMTNIALAVDMTSPIEGIVARRRFENDAARLGVLTYLNSLPKEDLDAACEFNLIYLDELLGSITRNGVISEDAAKKLFE